jgi:predicted dienelactone hydrolase
VRSAGTLAAALAGAVLAAGAHAGQGTYDPLAVASGSPEHVDLVATDATRARDLPLRVYLPSTRTAAPVVLFSHGLGGSREGSAYLGTHWARRGYGAVFLQHPGSDEAVWRDLPPRERLAALERAAGPREFLLRVRDVSAVLDQLARWNESEAHALARRLDLRKVGMSGHSFGGVTTQAVSGERFRGSGSFADPRIKAAVVMSPSLPRQGSPAEAFGSVALPWLLMTGTLDRSPIGRADAASRLEVFPALPAGGKYELVLDGAEHSAFGDRALPGDDARRNPNHHRAILALSTAFWDSYLREDAAARRWLDGGGPRGVLEPGDLWQRK